MKVTIRLAMRDWDYVTPLLLGDVRSDHIDVKVDRVGTLPEDFANDPRYEASEISFSRYSTARARGDVTTFGVPNFLMRGFRHRCIITSRASPVTRLEELKGGRIGVTGWQDSGNIWTRAALAQAGVGIEDVRWYAGRLTEAHPIVDRLGSYARPGRIEAVPGERPMLDLLESGELDAVFTPFMPPGFFGRDSKFRHLLTDLHGAELAYFNEVGHVPGIHISASRPDMAAKHPWLPQELSDLIDEVPAGLAGEAPQIRRHDAMDHRRARPLRARPAADWDASGLEPNRRMIADFLCEVRRQDLTDIELTPDNLFPPIPIA